MSNDPAQALKTLIGELVWNNAVLVGQIQQLQEELEVLKKEKINEPASS